MMTKIQLANEYNLDLQTVNTLRAWMTVNQSEFTSCTELAEATEQLAWDEDFYDKSGKAIDVEFFFELAAQYEY